MNIRIAYRESLNRHGHVRDDEQEKVVEALADLQMRLLRGQKPLRRLRQALRLPGANSAELGLYLWGGVGRGKTFLMDLFFATLGVDKKRRVHFHRMMADVHRQLKAYRDNEDPVDKVAGEIAGRVRVLCFDEFFVSDIADAMILARLLDGLFRRRVTLVATSNLAPADLYRNGLQRERFLPAIALLESHTKVLMLGGDTDYRLRLLQQAGTYMTPVDGSALARLDAFFDDIASGSSAGGNSIDILGREIVTERNAKDVVWFRFGAICDGPRSQQDYIEIARLYPTVIVSQVPTLSAEMEDQARRFIAMVDEFYDRKVKLIISANVPIESLYTGRKLRFEFQRTASRLVEMQSTAYLHAAHLP